MSDPPAPPAVPVVSPSRADAIAADGIEPAVRRGFWRRPVGRGLKWIGATLLAAALVLAGYLYFFGVLGSNFHTVTPAPRALYRSGQLSVEDLTARVQGLGVRTVLNLRGQNAGKPWYDAETAALKQLQVEQIDIKMSGRRMPTREQLVLLIATLKRAPRPLLVHCESGADRTGLACAFERLLSTPGDFDAARGELVFLPYGHTGLMGYEAMGAVVDQFEQYRRQGGALDVEQWAAEVYQPVTAASGSD